MARFEPPPTWAAPVLVDEKTGRAGFSPVWLKWFVDLTSQLGPTGAGSGTVESVGLSVLKDNTRAITGTPITGTGTLVDTAVDPGADRIVFWDDSASAKEYLTLGTNLSITGTTLNAAGFSPSGSITASGYTMSTARLLGRQTAGTGAIEEIAIVANNGLLFTGGVIQIDNASQADMETPTSGNKYPKTTAVLYHPGVVKAHCCFAPDGTVSANAYNVSSVTDHGAGDWTVNISGSFPLSGTTGTILISVDHSAPLIIVVNARTSASAYRIRCYDILGVLTDPTFVNFAILGDCS